MMCKYCGFYNDPPHWVPRPIKLLPLKMQTDVPTDIPVKRDMKCGHCGKINSTE